MGLPALSQPDLRIVPRAHKPENKTVGFYGNIDVFSSLGVTPISQTTVFKSITELKENSPAVLMLGVELQDHDIQLHSEVQRVLQFCAKKGIDVLYLREGNYPRILPGIDRLTIGGERNISPNELPRTLEVVTKLRAGFQSGAFTVDQILAFDENKKID